MNDNMTAHKITPSKMKARSGDAIRVKSAGFTLIEMAIVLVVIGLIVGGVMAGQNMIQAANMRAQITDLQKYKTAVKLFDELYQGIPGDITNAVSLFGATTADGNGNGFVEAATPMWLSKLNPDNGWYDGERPQFFIQLYLAGLIAEKYDGTATLGMGYPKVRINQATGMFASGPWNWQNIGGNNQYGNTNDLTQSNLYLAINVAVPSRFNVDCACAFNDNAGIFSPEEMWEIEKKIDDSVPSTGKMIAQAWSPSVPCCDAVKYNLAAGNVKVCNMLYDLTD